ncbi:MAG: hypothetical protein JETT_2905 [Candidatus Jettenia ecosi]|uniref:Uncharacterized protein n=1 Tax=Candidatus Jettenia ecosi TaxID=2494326 RepID=A0A533Q892_9BACT|nr:MAG: hypothetical protein JETT_2905 [Candidatus Jettenia ecosi]
MVTELKDTLCIRIHAVDKRAPCIEVVQFLNKNLPGGTSLNPQRYDSNELHKNGICFLYLLSLKFT